MNGTPHARTSDLPGWPTPPRVRDIVNTAGSWGWVLVSSGTAGKTHTLGRIFQDELGYLWADGNATPRFKHCDETDANPGAYL